MQAATCGSADRLSQHSVNRLPNVPEPVPALPTFRELRTTIGTGRGRGPPYDADEWMDEDVSFDLPRCCAGSREPEETTSTSYVSELIPRDI
jgi:hypothetical protein